MNLYIYSFWGQNRVGVPEGDREIIPWDQTPINGYHQVTLGYAWIRSLSVVTSLCTDRLRRVTVLYADLLG